MRGLQVIWIGLVLGVFLYAATAFALLTFGGIDFGLIDIGVVRVVAAAVVLYMVAAVLVRRRMVAGIARDLDPDARFQRYRVATIVGLAMLESGGVIVITAAMLADATAWVLAGGAAAVYLMVLARPKADEL